MALKTLEQKKQFEVDLEALLKPYVDELRKSKGFSFANISHVITLIVSAAITAVPLWKIATPEERKNAVVSVVNRYIDIPKINEEMERRLFGFVYDILILAMSKG